MNSVIGSLIYLIFIFAFAMAPTDASRVSIKSISIRHIRKNDFGLIFGEISSQKFSNRVKDFPFSDAVILNDESSPKETLHLGVHSERCCLYTNKTWDCDVQKN